MSYDLVIQTGLTSISSYAPTMRTLITAIAMVLPSVASAGCNAIAELRTDGLYLEISDRGCSDPLSIYFTRSTRKGGQPDYSTIKTYLFENECTVKWTEYVVSEFACQSNGRTPLAGATYRRTKIGSAPDHCAGVEGEGSAPSEIDIYGYKCIKGCRSGVPSWLDELTTCD